MGTRREGLKRRASSITKFVRQLSRPRFKPRRFVSNKHHGQVILGFQGILHQKVKYLKDVFDLAMQQPSYIIGVAFVCTFLTTWSVFAGIYYGIQVASDYTCIQDVSTYTEAFLYSIESQTTIGYGGRHPKDSCPPQVVVQSIQYILDSFIYGLVLLVVFCRVARPKYTKSVKISKRCCIYKERNKDGEDELKLSIRIVDYIPSDVHDAVVGAAITAKVYRETTADEPDDPDEIIQFEELMMEFDNAFDGGVLFLSPVPLDLVHTINEDSPLKDLSLNLLETTQIELVVCVSITIESTGNVYQIRRSFCGLGEFAWGYKFSPCVFEECTCTGGARRPDHAECFVIDFGRVQMLEPQGNMSTDSERSLPIGEDFREAVEVQTRL